MKLNTLFTLLISFYFFQCAGQVIVFETHEQYSANTGIEYDEWTGNKNSNLLYFKKGGVEKEIKTNDIWGFTLNGELWRSVNQKGKASTFMKLKGNGPLFYFESGLYHAAIYFNKELFIYDQISCYVASSIDGDLVPVYYRGGQGALLKAFGEENPQFQPFVDCIFNKEFNWVDNVRTCAESFYKGLNEEE